MNQETKNLIKSLELELLKPNVRKSEKRLNELLSDDFIEFGMFGKRYTKQDIVELLPNSGEDKFERYKASNFEAKEIALDTILLTYKASIEFLKTNETIWTLRCSIWLKRGENWQMIFHQGTVIK